MEENLRITYYGAFPLTGGRPTAVFRFFADSEKLPERFVPDSGWIEDHRLLLKQMSGDLGPADIVSEDVAMNIIQGLPVNNSSNA